MSYKTIIEKRRCYDKFETTFLKLHLRNDFWGITFAQFHLRTFAQLIGFYSALGY